MAETSRCPNCGAPKPADSPEGLCPRCLLQAALGETPAPTRKDSGTPEETRPERPHVSAATRQWPGETQEESSPHDGPAGLAPGVRVRYFGDYEIRRELGRGGMGVVYEAKQVSLNRPVAIKMVKAGVLADEAELRRFQNEAEAVAMLDHAGIVPVYEVGEREGQRYFSMKLVAGGNLAERLTAFKDDPRGAARLAAEVAEAVHHAHMRGILHRDLKPANVLIDPEGHPHVTDFGLAKRVEADVEFTQSGAILGTPAYMSPEQAAGRRGTITTATDVYGLGAILYALLAGKAPFGGDSVVETLDAVRNAPPPPPTKLNAKVPRDLETIALKCLEKDPRRRYSGAQALADDLRAWLENLPVSARRVGSAERAWLWCKRKPAIAALTASVVLALVAGTAAVVGVQVKAKNDLLVKNTELRDEKLRSDRAVDLSMKREDLAFQALDNYRRVVEEDTDLKNRADLLELRVRLLKSPRAYYRKLLGDLKSGTDQFKPEYQFYMKQRIALSHFALAWISAEIGSGTESLADYEEAKSQLEEMLAEGTRASRPTGQLDEVRDTLATTLNNLANLLVDQGRPTEARALHKRALAIREEQSRSAPTNVSRRANLSLSRFNLAWIDSKIGRPESAAANAREALLIREELARERPDEPWRRYEVAQAANHLGWLLNRLGCRLEGREHLKKSRDVLEALVNAQPASVIFRQELGQVYANTAESLPGPEAEGFFLKAAGLRERLVSEAPSVARFQADLAISLALLGSAMREDGRPSEALPIQQRACAIMSALVRAHPEASAFAFQYSNALQHYGLSLIEAQRGAEALEPCGRAIDLLTPLQRRDPSSTEVASLLGGAYSNRGWAYLTLKRFEEALLDFDRAIANQKACFQRAPQVLQHRKWLSTHYRNKGKALRGLGRTTEAIALEDERMKLWSRDLGPGFEAYKEYYDHACYSALNAVALARGRAEGELSAAEQAERRRLIEQATTAFRIAIEDGFRDAKLIQRDPDLDSLRPLPEFRESLLRLLDLTFPADPFATARGARTAP